jgi:hypothetical protein
MGTLATGAAPAPGSTSRVYPATIVDGLSLTAPLSERRLGDNDVSPGSDWYAIADMRGGAVDGFQPGPVHEARVAGVPQNLTGNANQISLSGTSWFFPHVTNVFYNHVSPPNGRACVIQLATLLLKSVIGNERNVGTTTPPTSRHRGGVAFALCDGSTRFLGDDIDFTIWRALGSRNLSEIIPDGWR